MTAGAINWLTAVTYTEINGTDSRVNGTASVYSPLAGVLANITVYDAGEDAAGAGAGIPAGACVLGDCAPPLGGAFVLGQPSLCASSCDASVDTVMARAYVTLASSNSTVEVGGLVACSDWGSPCRHSTCIHKYRGRLMGWGMCTSSAPS